VPGEHLLPDFDAVILAGGRAARMGGVDKPGLVVGSSTMAVAVMRAVVAAGAARVVMVGPARADLMELAHSLERDLTIVREDPPGSGPVPALRAGLGPIRAPWVAVLAADLPLLRAKQVRELLAAASRTVVSGAVVSGAVVSGAVVSGPVVPGSVVSDAVASGAVPDGAIMIDEAGARQWLLGCWRTAALRTALDSYGGASLGGLLGPLGPVLTRCITEPGEPPPWLDCDTPAELAAARAWERSLAPDEPPDLLEADHPDEPPDLLEADQ
jgi:molybdopterin-guanine dinucleotide biosynthesis protein A